MKRYVFFTQKQQQLTFSVFFMLLLWGFSTVTAQTTIPWTEFKSAEQNVKFKVPASFKTTNRVIEDVPMLYSAALDKQIEVYVYVFNDSKLSAEELFQQAVTLMDFDATGEIAEEEINGIQALVSMGIGEFEGRKLAMAVLAGTHGEHNYVMYITTDENKWAANQAIISNIIDSIAPMN